MQCPTRYMLLGHPITLNCYTGMICGACMPCHAEHTSRWQACCMSLPIVVHVQLDVLPSNHCNTLPRYQCYLASVWHQWNSQALSAFEAGNTANVSLARNSKPRACASNHVGSITKICVYPFLVQGSCNAVFASKSFAARIPVPHGGGLVGTESTCGASLSAAPLYRQSRSPVVNAAQKAALVP